MSVSKESIGLLARRHTAAMAARNFDEIRRIYAPDATIWHNTDRRTLNVDEHLTSYARNTAKMMRIDYSEVRLSVFDDRFLQQHLITAFLDRDKSFEIACCVVARVWDDRIVQLEEYLDSAVFLQVGLKTEH